LSSSKLIINLNFTFVAIHSSVFFLARVNLHCVPV
jgi:hypothetical protein